VRRWVSGLLLLVLIGACSQPAPPTAGDCLTAVRFEGTVYSDHIAGGFTARPVERLGEADLASCADVGPDARGAYFADVPPRIPVWAFLGYDPAEVLGVQESGGVRVLLADDLTADVRDDLIAELLRA
jgi:hypothetical protein